MNTYPKKIILILFLFGCVFITSVNSDNTKSKSQEKNIASKTTNKEDESVLAVVNGEKITVNDYNEKFKQLSNYEKAMYRSEEGHKEFLKELIQNKLMLQKAKELKLDKDAEVQKKIEELMREVTESAMIDGLVKKEVLDKVVVTDKEAKAYYDEHKETFNESEKVKIRQIVLATEDEAQKTRQELLNGADFEKLAREKSIDKNTARQGGDIGYIEKGKMLPEMEKICFDLKVGEISEPLKTNFGYYILKLEDKKPAATKEFYEVSDSIKGKLIAEKQQKEYQNWLNQLEKNAKIEMKADFLDHTPTPPKNKS